MIFLIIIPFVQIAGHLDYQKNLDQILEILGIPTQEHAVENPSGDSLKQWVSINRNMRNSASKSSMKSSSTSDSLSSRSDIMKETSKTSRPVVPELLADTPITAQDLEKQRSIDEAYAVADSIVSQLIIEVSERCEGKTEALDAGDQPVTPQKLPNVLEQLVEEMQLGSA